MVRNRTGQVFLVVFVSLWLATAALAQSPSGARLTSDKKPLPDAAPRLPIGKLPIIGNKLGALPEEVCSKLWQLDSDIDTVNKVRRTLVEDGVDLAAFNYLGDGIAGYTYTLMQVEDGRVRRFLLYRPTLTDSFAWEFLKKIAVDSQEKPTVQKGRIHFKFGGIHFYGTPVGSWQSSKAAVYRRNLDGSVRKTANAQNDAGPAAVELGIDDDDWLTLNVCKDPKMLQAIQDHKLLKGMRPVEAFLSMKEHRLYRQSTTSGYTWTWTDTRMEVQDYTTVSDTYGTSTIVKTAPHEHLFARVKFKDGLVDTIEDETELVGPPSGS